MICSFKDVLKFSKMFLRILCFWFWKLTVSLHSPSMEICNNWFSLCQKDPCFWNWKLAITSSGNVVSPVRWLKTWFTRNSKTPKIDFWIFISYKYVCSLFSNTLEYWEFVGGFLHHNQKILKHIFIKGLCCHIASYTIQLFTTGNPLKAHFHCG